MNMDPFGLYPARRIRLGERRYMESPLPRLSTAQIEAVRAIVVQHAVGGHHTAAVDRTGSGFLDLVAAVTIGWDAIGENQLIMVVSQGFAQPATSMLDLAIVPYAAPSGGAHALHQTDERYWPDSAAMLLDEVVAAIREIDGLAPPQSDEDW